MKNIFMVIILMLTFGCMAKPLENAAEPEPGIRILALGDSYTIGEGVPASERWPVLLAAGLKNEDIRTEEPIIIAKTGWTSGELLGEISDEKHKGIYSLVFVQIGVNNQFRGFSPETYREEFKKIQEKALEFSGNKPERVFVLSIPDWGVTSFAEGQDRDAIAEGINIFNQINAEETTNAGFKYIDVTAVSRKAADDKTLITGDGLHPSGKMYREWVELIKPEVIKTLR